jgi:hypothetical protein
VINVTKGKYWKTLVQKAIATIERKAELKLNVLQAMHMITSTLNSVSSVTITNCFRKAVFVNTAEEEVK